MGSWTRLRMRYSAPEVSQRRLRYHSNRGLLRTQLLRHLPEPLSGSFLTPNPGGNPIVSPNDRARGPWDVEPSQEGSGPRWGWGAIDLRLATWMNPEVTMLNEVSQSEKDKYCIIPLTGGPLRNQIPGDRK